MSTMAVNLGPDELVVWQWGVLELNATILYTWLLMGILSVGSWLVTRRLSTDVHMSRWQNGVEAIVVSIREQIAQASQQDPDPYLPFIGTLFLYIAVSNLLTIVPGYHAPTGSLSTTAALAACVFIAVPMFGIARQGVRGYVLQYLKPTVFMLPFNIIGELSRTLALAVRLYGNIMSGSVIAVVLLTITPILFPVVMQMLGLITGLIQAYIFAVLAMVYIASATSAHEQIELRHRRNHGAPSTASIQSKGAQRDA